jgi:hypothetical protein
VNGDRREYLARIIDGQVVLAKTFLYTNTPYIIINGWSII